MDDDNGKGASKNEQFGEGWERDPNRINPHLQVKNYYVHHRNSRFDQPGDVGRLDWGAGGCEEPGLHLELLKDLLPGENYDWVETKTETDNHILGTIV